MNEEALWSVLLTEYYYGDKIEKNEMGRSFGTNGRQERCIHDCDGDA
jgi:hypothetical protein